jgi:hypothetical protein
VVYTQSEGQRYACKCKSDRRNYQMSPLHASLPQTNMRTILDNTTPEGIKKSRPVRI